MKSLARVPRRVPVAIRRARQADVGALGDARGSLLHERPPVAAQFPAPAAHRPLRLRSVAERADAVVGYGLGAAARLDRARTSLFASPSTRSASGRRHRHGPARGLRGGGHAWQAASSCVSRSAAGQPRGDPDCYHAAGYKEIGTYADYYEDHSDALRMEKQLAGGVLQSLNDVEFYAPVPAISPAAPASLMMGMHALDSAGALDRSRELRPWREATLIFTTSGHGGCGAHGLALAARRRGFHAEVFVSDEGVPFVDSVRGAEKREVMRLVHEDFQRQCNEAGIPVHIYSLSADELGRAHRRRQDTRSC